MKFVFLVLDNALFFKKFLAIWTARAAGWDQKLVAASKMRGDIKRYEAAAPFGEIFARLSTVSGDFDESEGTKSSKTTKVNLFFGFSHLH